MNDRYEPAWALVNKLAEGYAIESDWTEPFEDWEVEE